MPGQCALHDQLKFDVSVDFSLILAPKTPLADAEVDPTHLGAFVTLLVDPNISVCLQFASHIPQLLLVLLGLPLTIDLEMLPALQAYQGVILAGVG